MTFSTDFLRRICLYCERPRPQWKEELHKGNPETTKIMIKQEMHGDRSQGFLKADAAPITTAKTSPTPAPRDAPTAAAVREFALFCESRLAFAALSCSLANSSSSLSLASS